MIFLLLSLVVAAFAKDIPADSFIVRLEDPPETRWNEVIKAKLPLIQGFAKYIEDKVGSGGILAAGALLKTAHISDDIKREIQGISKISGIPYNNCLVMNFMYEFYSACTSIVVKTPDNHILFGRNLDYDFANLINKILIEVTFMRNGATAYKAVSFAGYAGIITGMKPDAFSISLNQRDMRDSVAFWESISIVTGHTASAFAIRTAFETKATYTEAKEYLKKVPLIAGSYFIIGGTTGNEGAIITRSRSYASDVWELTDDKWFLAQTNYDHWLIHPKNDDRYHPAVAMLEKLGKGNVDQMALYDILSTSPILRNDNSTIHSTVMHPFRHSFYNRVRIY